MFSLTPTSPTRPWLLTPHHYAHLARTVMEQKAVAKPSAGIMADMIEDMEEEFALTVDPLAPGLATLYIQGVLYFGASPEEECFLGLYNTDRLLTAIQQVYADPSIKALALVIDSPGGYVTAIQETAQALHTLAATTPVLAYTSNVCASAAYWIASASSALHAAPYADVSGIGVYQAIIDDTAYWQQQGVTFEYIRDGKYKAMGMPGKAYTADEIKLITDGVNATSDAFKGAVKSYRPAVTDEQMQGQCFTASDPTAAGLVDSIAFRNLGGFLSYAARVAVAIDSRP